MVQDREAGENLRALSLIDWDDIGRRATKAFQEKYGRKPFESPDLRLTQPQPENPANPLS